MTAPFRVGLVGAGYICDHHASALQGLPGVELIGLADLDGARARASAARWRTTAHDRVERLIDAGATVIHVLTPPAAHASVARVALEAGCHVLLEKPATETEHEARELAQIARARGLTVTVNHSLLYDPQVRRALAAVRAGALGQVVSVDVLRGSEYPPYPGGALPPWQRDAGYPVRDVGVHCLYLIHELLGPIEHIDASWQSLGGEPNLPFDEWRAVVRCRGGLGQFQLTYNARPLQSQLLVHGTRGVLRVDLFAMFHGRRAATPLPRPAERVVTALADSLQPLVDVPLGAWKFARRHVQPYQGLRDLIADFYRRLAAGEPPPVSLDEAAEIVGWTDRIARAADAEHRARLTRFTLSEAVPFLVTGASGSLGRATVRRLRARGQRVRVFVRRAPEYVEDGVEVCVGNLGDPEAVGRAIRGARVVIHCGAAMAGDRTTHEASTVIGTRNVVDACARYGVAQLVHVSSLTVIDRAGAAGRGPITEDAALEPRPEERGAYTRAKLEAEQLVTRAARDGLPCAILRPGQIFGGGIPLITGAVARAVGGRWLVLGDGTLRLPLVYVDDVVDAITMAVERRLAEGQIIQILDPEPITQDDVLQLAGGGRPVVHVPRAVALALGKLSELPLGALGRPSPIAMYRLSAALARVTFGCARANELLGWRPRVGVREGIRRVTEDHEALTIARATRMPSRAAETMPPA